MTLTIKNNFPFSKLTTFKIGGNAKHFVEVKNDSNLLGAVKFAKSKKLPVFVIGGGSDILVSDDDFNGLVVKLTGKKIQFQNESNDIVQVRADAGVVWDNLVEKCVSKGLRGTECLSGIPGNVGAAPIQNIGAYGQELKDVFVCLSAYDLKKDKLLQLNKVDCEFSYRESVFKRSENKSRFIITSITLRLNKNKKSSLAYASLVKYFEDKRIKNPTLFQIRNAVLNLRGQKLDDPKLIGNAGSFFKNPIVRKEVLENLKKDYSEIPSYELQNDEVKLYAGWLIEKTGWKGKIYKNAAVSDKNALVITNPKGRATAREIMELANLISDDVYKNFGVRLEPEVQFIDFRQIPRRSNLDNPSG